MRIGTTRSSGRRGSDAGEALPCRVIGSALARLRGAVTPAAGALLLAISLLLAGAPGRAQESASDTAAAVAETTSRHTMSVDGRSIDYTVKVGTIGLPEEGAPTTARLVFTSYTLDGADAATRPLSFVVNGGPGAASAYLHLGALGPVRLVFAADGSAPAPPSRTEPNPRTWLTFTDLVFIDPVGTGFSRSGASRDEDGHNEREFWAVDADLDAMGGFIRQYLTRNERWRSPKVLVGESYGGYRMAALSTRLPARFGVALNGTVLISPALELQLQGGSDWDILPWVLRVPSMAAIASAHGKGRLTAPVRSREDLREIEEWALGPLVAGLAMAGRRDGAEDGTAFDELARLTGLDRDLVRHEQGRISVRTFAEELLSKEDLFVSLYDGRITSPKLRGRADDRFLTQVTAALAGGLAEYLRNDLGVGTSLPYLVLNDEVFQRWSWEQDGRGGRRNVGAAAELADSVTANPDMRVLVLHGLHDLVTPYLGSVYLIDQLVDASAKPRVTVRVYPGGHMFYTVDESSARMRDDAAALYADIQARLTGG